MFQTLMTKSVFPVLPLLFVFLIFLVTFLPLISGRHSPKRRDERTNRNSERNAIGHDDHHQQQHRNDKRHENAEDDHHKSRTFRDKRHENEGKKHGKRGAEELSLSQDGRTKGRITPSTNTKHSNNKNEKQQQHNNINSEVRKELSLQSCDQLGRHYFSHCFEMSSKSGHCSASELPMRVKDCLHLKKFINTNLHTLVEAPFGTNFGHTAPSQHHGAVHANGEHVGAFVTATNVMCCSVEMENALHHAIQMVNNRLMLAHELALYRFAHEISVDDLEREAIALKSVGNQANAAGIDAEFVVNFLLAQMEANKMIQRGYIERWNSDHSFESKYVPDLEKEIHPKMDYATNALILALIPLISAGHQLYNDQNCVEHVENVWESMEHLRASEMEPNGKLAMEKAVRGICDKVLPHEAQSISEDQEISSKKRRKLNADGHEAEKNASQKSKNKQKIESARRRAHKTSSTAEDESERSAADENNNKTKHRSPEKKEKTRKPSPRTNAAEDEAEAKKEARKVEAKSSEEKERRIDRRRGDQNGNVKKVKSDQNWEDGKVEKGHFNPENDDVFIESAEKKPPKRFADNEKVSDRSIMIKAAEKTEELSRENMIEQGKVRYESDLKDFVAEKVKSPKKSPRRIEVSDRSLLLKMEEDELRSDEREESQKYIGDKKQKNSSQSGEKSREIKRNWKPTAAEEIESEEAYSKRQVKSSPFKKRVTADQIDQNHSAADDQDKSIGFSIGKSRKISSTEKSRNLSLSPRNVQQEDPRKDSLISYRKRRLMDQEKSKSIENGGKRDKSMDEEDNRLPRNKSYSMERNDWTKVTSAAAEQHEEQLQWDDETMGEKSRKDNEETNQSEKEMGKADESAEYHHIELEPDAESIVIHTPGGEKPMKIKLSRKSATAAKGEDANKKEENGKADEGEAMEKPSKSKFTMKKANWSISAEEKNKADKSEESIREKQSRKSSPKNKFTIKKVGSDENENLHKKGEEIGEKQEKESSEMEINAPKNKFKMKRIVGSVEEMNETVDKVRGEQSGELSKKSPIDKSNEYVAAPEKISAEFGGKTAEMNGEIGDHLENFENDESRFGKDKK